MSSKVKTKKLKSGTKVIICGKHPWASETGIIKDFEYHHIFGEAYIIVLSDGRTGFFKEKEIRKIKHERI